MKRNLHVAAAVLIAIGSCLAAGCSEPDAACDGSRIIDGLRGGDGVRCDEYAGEGAKGVFSVVHVAREGDTLFVHNDWLVRDDAPMPDDYYNVFVLSDLEGELRVELRVWADSRAALWVDGVSAPATTVEGASAYAPSRVKAKPHAQFEFAVSIPGICAMLALPPTCLAGKSLVMKDRDPAPGPFDNPDDALIDEPTTLLIDMDTGVVAADPDRPMLASAKRDGATDVRLDGIALGPIGGFVKRANLRPATIVSWSASGVVWTGPFIEAGEKVRVQRADGPFSNAITLLAGEVPPVDLSSCAYRLQGALCDDGRVCTSGDVCVGQGAAATCVGTVACPDSGPCLLPACDAAGACTTTPKALNTPCPGGTPPCAIGLCDTMGQCKPQNAGKGIACDDGLACTSDDACNGGGICVGKDACPQGEPCVVRSCGPSGCSITKLDNPNDACDPGSACVVNAVCVQGACTGEPLQCDAQDQCHAASCVPTVGCVQTPLALGVPCDDGDICSGDDVCDGAGVCKGAIKPSCK